MPDDEIIAIGDKIEIVGEEGRAYKTMVEDMTGNGLFLVGMPSYGRMPVILHKGDAFTVHFSRESGIFATYMRVLGFEKKGDIRYVWLHQETRPRRYQRRGAYRLPVNLKVMVCDRMKNLAELNLSMETLLEKLQEHGEIEEADVLETAGATDISVTGLALVVKKEYDLNEELLLKPLFREQHSPQPSFLIGAEVMRSIPESYRSRHCIGLRFIGQTNSVHDYLSKYVVAGQQKQIRQGNRG